MLNEVIRRREVWRSIPGELRYEISNLGRLRRVLPGPGTRVGRISHCAKRADGYLQIFCIPGFNMMHQLVAFAFLGQCPKGKEVNHKNGDRSDAARHNLEYLTRRENVLHGIHVLHPELLQKRREQARVNGRKAEGTHPTPYVRTAEHRRMNGLRKVGHTPWWERRGFASLHVAMQARGVIDG